RGAFMSWSFLAPGRSD
ncbi:MAG: hypothetical protein AMXMBFR13_33630, partial [Phycisphaerae bacterium]